MNNEMTKFRNRRPVAQPNNPDPARQCGIKVERSNFWKLLSKLHSLSTSLTVRLLICVAVLILLGGGVRWLTGNYKNEMRQGEDISQSGYIDLEWQALIPKGWNPLKRFRDKAQVESSDGDPAAMDLARQMRETWDNAPTNKDMNGAKVRLLGYVVPLESSKSGLKEFLLVPYFGACIHVPPPPANQIVHVSFAEPVKGVRTMESVWVTGTLSISRKQSTMGMSGYSLDAVRVERRSAQIW